MTAEYDLVVIGTGAAGRTVAFTCAEAGWSVAVADERPLGGTCALRGCDAKKVLAGAAEVIARAKGLEHKGIAGDPGIDWGELMAFKTTFTESLPAAMEGAMDEAGIRIFREHASFSGTNRLLIGAEEVRARKVVIASGARPRTLHIPGEEHLTTSDDFLSAEALPQRIVCVGGGFISFEFAHIAACAGAEVTILNRSDRLLRGFDGDLVDMLAEATREAGIRIVMDTPVRSIRRTGDELVVVAGAGEKREFAADMAVHGAGRVPAIEGLDPEAAGIAVERGRIRVNEFLQSTTNPDVYAAGDASATGPQLTPVATADGEVVAHNLLHGNSARADYSVVAGVVFTYPPLAGVGMTEEEAQSRGLRYVRHFEDTSTWYASRRVGVSTSGYKILVDEDGFLLGAHLLGHGADEQINVFSLAMKAHLGVEALRGTHWAYPTAGWDIRNMLI
jgi:glutathione reductase (NADPH)